MPFLPQEVTIISPHLLLRLLLSVFSSVRGLILQLLNL